MRDLLPRQPFGLSAFGEAATSAARRDSSPTGVPVCRLTNFDSCTRSATYKNVEKFLSDWIDGPREAVEELFRATFEYLDRLIDSSDKRLLRSQRISRKKNG
jgi:hypothetical protein